MLPLTSERLILRDFTEKDFEAVHKYAKDPEVVKFMPWGPNTVEDTNSFLKRKLEEQRVNPRIVYDVAVTLKDSGLLIGGCGLQRKNTDSTEGSIGYCLNKKYWGKGIGTEVAQTLIRFGFMELGLHRIFATCDPENTASRNVLEKNGLRLEGHFRENIRMRGQWRDTLTYAILEHEWKKLRHTR